MGRLSPSAPRRERRERREPASTRIAIPDPSGSGRNTKPSSQAQSSSAIYIDSDDDDDVDELAHDSIPCSSPYFTQPTQLVNRTTQPTQIVKRTTLGAPSSPLVPSTPSTAIEVPASSPFQPKSQARPAATLDKNPNVATRVGSLMVPAGTSYRPPATRQAPQTSSKPSAQRDYLDISDDDLLADYKNRDSSDDERPPRGDIRPSSFVKKPLSAKPEATQPLQIDISFNDIRDIRLRHLTRQVYNIVENAVPGITIKACKEALQKDFSWQVSKAVDLLTGRPTKTLSEKPSGASGEKAKLDTAKRSAGPAPKSVHPFFKKAASVTDSSNSSQESTQQSLSHSTNKSIVAPKSAPRRRLVQKRRQSPTPPEVFSLASSATSKITTPEKSIESSSTSDSEQPPMTYPQQRRRRLVQGRQRRSPSPVVVSSDTESEATAALVGPAITQGRNKRRAEAKIQPRQQKKTKVEHHSAEEAASSDTPTKASSPEPPKEKATKALKYLNSCTAEDLGRVIGSAADAKLMITSRPFQRISQAKMVSREDKSKSKSRGKRKMVGEDVVQKLDVWFAACDVAVGVIDECEVRGRILQDIMSQWPVDGNGVSKPNADATELPISEKPQSMSEDYELKSYQLVGLNWMSLLHAQGYGGILADDMGLGKTCQVISFIAYLVEAGHSNSRPNLIVVPSSTFENWVNEFSKFAPSISVLLYSGTNREDIDLDYAREHDVVLTTYSQVEKRRADVVFLKKLRPYAAIFDEGQKLKNPNTKVYEQLMQVPTKLRLLLSGTPVQNNLKELLAMLRFIEPDLFEEESFETLRTIFEARVTSKDVFNFAALASGRVSRARAVMAPFILQRRKEDVIDLPAKIERVEVVGMHDSQRDIYDSIKSNIGSKADMGSKSGTGSKDKDANPWMMLRKAAIHHQLFRRHFDDATVKKMVDILWQNCSAEELYVDDKKDRFKTALLDTYLSYSDFYLHLICRDFDKYIGHLDIPHRSWEESPKVAKLLELVRHYQTTGDRVLVFSRFEMVVNILQETFHCADIEYCCLTGKMETAARFPECERFTNDPSIPVFLLTTGAGGTGLNLTAANKIILFDQSDNPQDDVQATNRAHRIGQTCDVEVIRFITEKSVEVLVYNSGIKKLALASSVAQQAGAAPQTEASLEEECKRRMILGEDETEAVELAPPSQSV
ncbi:SNF2 family N-terminal domain-containing protein [Hypoxylon sp. FL1284]|nr:SNF2 family N-terminal domain-containing protein [Hypoxylon sp. FL1284]